MVIEIHLRDPAAPVIRLTHPLKLHADSSTATPAAPTSSASAAAERPVVSEHYDEICFNKLPADEAARKLLLKGPTADSPAYPHQEHLTTWSEEPDLQAVHAARAWVAERAAELTDRLNKGAGARAMLQKQLEDLGVTG